MKLVYTHENRVLVSHAKNLLEMAGIHVALKNEYAAGAAGDLSPFDTWVELWVHGEDDYNKGCALLDARLTGDSGEDWYCSQCQEINGASFEFCWQCHSEKC